MTRDFDNIVPCGSTDGSLTPEFNSFASNLLACLESILLSDPAKRALQDRRTKVPPNEQDKSGMAKTWTPGKATEILNRFKTRTSSVGGTDIACLPNGRGIHHPQAPSSFDASRLRRDEGTHYGDLSDVHTTSSMRVEALRRPFRPPTRIHQDATAEPSFSGSATKFAQDKNICSKSQQVLFTTHSLGGAERVYSSSTSVLPPHQPLNGVQMYPKSIYSLEPSTMKKEPQTKTEIDLGNDHYESEEQKPNRSKSNFKSAYELMLIDDKAKGIKRPLPPPVSLPTGPTRKIAKIEVESKGDSDDGCSKNPEVNELIADERLKNIEPKMVEAVLNEVVEVGASTDWNDIAGLEGVKAIIREIIIWPMQRPDLFTGLRGPPKGVLLFGPPGTGKTMFGRLIATKSESTFFNISASSLMSKWCGDGEKMVRALFQVARVKQPAVIFIDEIDSILTQRSDSEHETSRRLKTEFLIQFDGCGTKSEDKILVIGVTNRPQELDEAARRRLVKRIYIPLPDANGRQQLIRNLLKDQSVALTDEDYENVAALADGYSGADMASLCKEAAYGPIRDIGHDIQHIQVDKVRPIYFQDFQHALKHVKASVTPSDLTQYEMWDKNFGCHA